MFDESNFRLVETPVPEPGEGEILIHNIWLSVDPYMRGRMNAGKSYAKPVEVGAVMEGGTVGEVVASNHPDFRVGDIVEERLGWQEYGVTGGRLARRIDPCPGAGLDRRRRPRHARHDGLFRRERR